MRVLLKQVRPNPFRNIERYPYSEAKIQALRESIKETGFWENIVGRRMTALDGAVVIEQAYGHHRMEALRREYPDGNIEIEMPIRDLTDGAMLQIMARENMTEWGTNAWVEIETIRAIVVAYARGNIELPEPSKDTPKTHLRFAPSFQPGNVQETYPERPYTASTIAPFVGWSADKVRDVLSALELVESGILDDSDYADMTTSQAEAITKKAQQIREGARQRAKQAEAESAQDREEAERARQAEQQAAREQAEARRRAQEARDDKLAAQARQAEEAARASYDKARQAREAAEASANARKAEAEEARAQGAAAAGEAAREAAGQLRSGTSVREVMKQRPAAETANAPYLDGKCKEAAAVLRRILSDSDISKLLQMVSEDHGRASEEARKDLYDALQTMGGHALTWVGKLGIEFVPATSEQLAGV